MKKENLDLLAKLYSKRFQCTQSRLLEFVKKYTQENPGISACGMGDHNIADENKIYLFDGDPYNLESNSCSSAECFLSGLDGDTINEIDGIKKQPKEKKTKEEEKTQKDYAYDIMNERRFLTLDDTHEILHYMDGIYRFRGENEVMKEAYNRVPVCSIRMYREIAKYVITKTLMERNVFDSDHDLVNLTNCIYNIKTGETLEHTPDIPFRQQLNVAYDKSAKAEKFEKFMAEILPDSQDRTTIYEMFAAPLIPELNIERILVCVGEGRNGKSTLFKIMTDLYGEDVCSHVAMEEINGSRFYKALLDGKKLNLYSDISSHAMNDIKTIKSLVSRDSVMAEKKNLPPFRMVNKAVMYFSCNRLPDIKEDADGTFRRFRIVYFEQTFSKDQVNPYLFDEMKEEKSGILNILIKHTKTLLKNKGLTYDVSIDQTRKEWREGVDTVQNFLDKCTEKVEGSLVPKDILYQAYVGFCKSKDDLPKDVRGFSGKVSEFGFTWKMTKYEGKSQRVWADIKLKSDKYNTFEAPDTTNDETIEAVPDTTSKENTLDSTSEDPSDTTSEDSIETRMLLTIFSDLEKSGTPTKDALTQEMIKSEKWDKDSAEKEIDELEKSGRISFGGSFFCKTCNAGPFRYGTVAFGGKQIEQYHDGHDIEDVSDQK